jgi:hypothetical protein
MRRAKFRTLRRGGFYSVVPLLLLVSACGVGSAATGLYEQAFVVDELREHGEVRAVVSDPVHVSFEEDEFEGYDDVALLRWDTGCNEFETIIEVTSQHVTAIPHALFGPKSDGQELSPVASGSSRDCPHTEQEEGEWLVDFFLADLAWTLDGETLVLESDAAEMVLQKR